jgi:chorismate mutase
MSEDQLEALRVQIRAVDRELVTLIGRRRDLVVEIGAAKETLGLPILDPAQEAKVVRRGAALARELEVDEELIRDVIWRIIASARDAQEGRTRWGPPPPDVADTPPTDEGGEG